MHRSTLSWRRAILGLVVVIFCAAGQFGSARAQGPSPRWTWGPAAAAFSNATDVWSAPIHLHLFDTNGDSKADLGDETSIVFVSGSSVDPMTGVGTTCDAIDTCKRGVLRFLNAKTGTEQVSLDKAFSTSMGFAGVTVAAGDALRNGTTQIAAMTGEGYIVLLSPAPFVTVGSPALNIVAISDQPVADASNPAFGRSGALAIGVGADGVGEIAYGATVFTVNQGSITLQFAGPVGSGGGAAQAISIFADLNNSKGDELIAGNAAYKDGGGLIWHRSDLPDGFNAVADFDGDSFLEVVLVADGQLYVLDGSTGATRVGPLNLPGTGPGGPPTIADFDGDGDPDIGVATGGFYSTARPDLTFNKLSLYWSTPTHEQGSSVSSAIAFDFSGAGLPQLAYADACFVWVLDGASGSPQAVMSRTSFGSTGMPIVADVNFDGHAELIVASNGTNPKANGLGCLDTNGDPVVVNNVAWQPAMSPTHAYRGITAFENDAWPGTKTEWTSHTYRLGNTFRTAEFTIPAPPCGPECEPPPAGLFDVDAGPDQTVTYPAPVFLNAQHNRGPSCFQCYFQWLDGGMVPIADGESVLVVLNPGVHNIVLNASANTGLEFDSDTVVITVLPSSGGGGDQGPPGPPGPIGPMGPMGPAGSDGAPGKEGPQGPIGLMGPQGPAGAKGLTGLTGPQGPAGSQGPMGLTGPAGAQGPAGAKGSTGATGPQGVMGPQGATGPQGAKGEKGDSGGGGDALFKGAIVLLPDYVHPPSGFKRIGSYREERVDLDQPGGRKISMTIVMWQKL